MQRNRFRFVRYAYLHDMQHIDLVCQHIHRSYGILSIQGLYVFLQAGRKYCCG